MPTPTRPDFPDGYGVTPETPHLPSDWQGVQAQIQASRSYWICTATPQGQPHAMPVWGVWCNTALYLVTKRKSKKAVNLFQNPQVVVHLESADDLVVLEGIAAELTDPTQRIQVADAYSVKYNGDQIYHDIEVIFELQPHKAFSWLESNFHETATKWEFNPD